MAVSSYGSATRTSGVVRIVKDLDVDLDDRHVLVVEDIVDSGLTLNYLQRYLLARARQVSRCAPCWSRTASSAPSSTCGMSGFTIPPSSWWDMALMSTSACAISGPSTASRPDGDAILGLAPPASETTRVTVDTVRIRRASGRPELLSASARIPTGTGWSRRRAGWPGCTRSSSPGSARIRPTTSR